MKKFILAIASGLTMMLLSGCGGGGSDDGPVPETYFITDSFGDGVRFRCIGKQLHSGSA